MTAGGVEYRPVRRTTKLMAEVRRIGRRQNSLNRRAEALEREAAHVLEDSDTEGREGLEDAAAAEERAEELAERSDELRDEATTLTFLMLGALLADDEGNRVDAAVLEEAVDVNIAADLAGYLMGSDDDEPDPTPATPATSS